MISNVSSKETALRLEYFTIGWNVVEGVIALGSGILAGSIALVGFGFDSCIEVGSAALLVWRLRKPGEEEAAAEKRAILFIGITFFALAAYVTWESSRKLLFVEAPAESFVGIMLAALSTVIMPILGWRKMRVAEEIGSRALAADAVETFICSYLSVALLLGLALNACAGWWWADPVAGLAMVPLIVREGWEAVEEARE